MSSVTFSTTVGGDGSTVTDDDDATTGLRNGGWRTRFVPALAQEVAVAANAVASATAALSSKNSAAASATTATTQAGNASTSATAAANSATAAAASYDSFDDRYLGVKTSDPSVDNDGNALLVGALYWNSATSVFKVWSGSAWITNLTSNQFGTGVATFLQTPSSSNLAAALTDETGTGANVFASNPTFPAQINLTANSGYNIYASGTADNYLAGRLGVGTTANASTSLRVATGITGSTFSTGILSDGTVQSDVTSRADMVLIAPYTAASAFTLTKLVGYKAQLGGVGAGSAISAASAFEADPGWTGATNNYGFYGAIASGTGRYNLYMAGTADNFLAGNIGVGVAPVSSITAVGAGQTTASFNTSTGLGGALIVGDSNGGVGVGGAIVFSGAGTAWRFAAIKGMATNGASNSQGDLVFSVRPSATDATLTEAFRIGANKNATFAGSVYIGGASSDTTLRVTSNITGGVVAVGVLSAGTIQSDVTTQARYFSTAASTVAASFTNANLYHYLADQGSFGAGSTVTTQIGFSAAGALTGATNNYGFYGGIASGTGRYNLYMAGTADNYLAGSLGVGTSSPSASAILDAQSTTKGVRFPNMTTTQKNAVSSPAAGLVVFDTTLSKLCVYTGAAWQTITSV